jgi:hypothetical protein
MSYRSRVGFDQLTQQKTLGGVAAKHMACSEARIKHRLWTRSLYAEYLLSISYLSFHSSSHILAQDLVNEDAIVAIDHRTLLDCSMVDRARIKDGCHKLEVPT